MECNYDIASVIVFVLCIGGMGLKLCVVLLTIFMIDLFTLYAFGDDFHD